MYSKHVYVNMSTYKWYKFHKWKCSLQCVNVSSKSISICFEVISLTYRLFEMGQFICGRETEWINLASQSNIFIAFVWSARIEVSNQTIWPQRDSCGPKGINLWQFVMFVVWLAKWLKSLGNLNSKYSKWIRVSIVCNKPQINPKRHKCINL